MPEIDDGQTLEVRGSSGSTYTMRNVGGVYSCSCPAWRNQSHPAHQRTCKHLRALRGVEAEAGRLQLAGLTGAVPLPPADAPSVPAPPLLLAHSWDQVSDLTGWWMSEKLDGVRAYWDGKRLISRLGNAFVAPDWFVAALPDWPLDGELWSGRKQFQRTVSIVRRQDASNDWRQVRYLVFDAPSSPGPFEDRLARCRQQLETGPEHLEVLSHQSCQGTEHLRAELARVEAQGGEGLMLRQRGSTYEVGRSHTLLKIKSFHDAEALVVGHLPGEGRHKGRLGAVQVKLADGTLFSVGTGFSDAERAAPPLIGSTITFRYQELSNGGVPRFPTFVRAAVDVKVVVAPVVPPPAVVPVALQSEAAAAIPEAPDVASRTTRSSSAAAPLPEGFRRFSFVEGGSSKFWEVGLAGCVQTVRYGRLGSAGQSKSKPFASESEAARDTAKLIAEKLAKGYREGLAQEASSGYSA